MSYKVIPNILTFLRIILVIPCAYFFYTEAFSLSIAIFILASATDCVDGFLARRFACQTQLGAILDPLADKFLIISLFSIITLKNYLPLWFSIIIISREFILLSGAAYYRLRFGPVVFVPTMISKINTGLLLFLLLITLVQAMQAMLSMMVLNLVIDYLKYYLIIIILITSLLSAVDYIYKWSRRVKNLLVDLKYK